MVTEGQVRTVGAFRLAVFGRADDHDYGVRTTGRFHSLCQRGRRVALRRCGDDDDGTARAGRQFATRHEVDRPVFDQVRPRRAQGRDDVHDRRIVRLAGIGAIEERVSVDAERHPAEAADAQGPHAGIPGPEQCADFHGVRAGEQIGFELSARQAALGGQLSSFGVQAAQEYTGFLRPGIRASVGVQRRRRHGE